MVRPIDARRRRAGGLARAARWFALALAALLLLDLGISSYAALAVTSPRRQPVRATPADVGLRYEDVRFPARGGDVTIAGWYVPLEGARRAVVLVHGKDSSRSAELGGRLVELAAGLRASGLAVLLIDMRGHGDSGPARFSFGLDERRDVVGAVDWLESRGFRPGSVGVLGVSLGAASAIGAAHDDPDIGAVVSDCSYAEIYPLMQMHWAEASHLPDFMLPSTLLVGRVLLGKDISTARPVAEVPALGARLMVIHGSGDAFTPVEHGRALAAADPGATYWEVPGAAHASSYLAAPREYTDRVARFFDARLAP